jgi:translation initiation factor 6 (eIF-6)
MKNNKAVKLQSRFAAFCLVLSILATTSMFALAAGNVAGEIIVSGHGDNASVTLNGEKAFSGRTFFSSGRIATSDSSAIINLGKLGRVSMAPNSTLDLSFTENTISGEVLGGEVKVLNNEGVTVDVKNLETEEQAASSKAKKGAGFWVPVAILAGAVGAAILFVTLNRDDDVTSPAR